MRPKTKIQVAVYNLSNNLPKLTKDQENYITSKLFEKRCFATKNKAFCLECGSDINVNTISRKRVVCPHCKNKLKVESNIY